MTTYINYTVEPNYLEAHRWCNNVSMLTMYAVDCGFKPKLNTIKLALSASLIIHSIKKKG